MTGSYADGAGQVGGRPTVARGDRQLPVLRARGGHDRRGRSWLRRRSDGLAALRQLLDPDRPTASRLADPVRTVDPTRPPAPGHPYGRRVLADELAALGRATPGQRNRTLNRTAFKAYRYVAGGLLDEEEVTLAFTTVARAIGLSAAETARTLASARTAGLANPRTIPAPPDPSQQETGA